MKKCLNKNSSTEEFLKSLELLDQTNGNNEETKIIERIIKVNKKIQEHPNQNFSKEKNKLLKYLKQDYIGQINEKRLQDALLRSIIEQNHIYKLILEDYYRQSVIEQKNEMPREIINALMNKNELLQYILEFDSYDEFLLSKNISRYLPTICDGLADITDLIEFDNNFELLEKLINILQVPKLDLLELTNNGNLKFFYINYIRDLLLYHRNSIYVKTVCQQKLCDALLRTIIEKNLHYKKCLELYYRESIINHTDKITDSIADELIGHDGLLQYILEFNSFDEYLKSKKLF